MNCTSPVVAYASLGHSRGCSSDQLLNFARARISLHARQLEAGAAARLCDSPDGPTFIGYGGARGGGKSHWLLSQMGADDCQRYPGLKCLLIRKVGKSNLENFDDIRRRAFGRLDHTFIPSRGTLLFKNGSRIISGHFQKESDIDAYLGLEYDLIGIEEATTLTNRKHTDITTCLRTSKKNWRPRIYSTSNPGGVGHAWYRAKFIVPYHQKTESDTRFIPARVTDNIFTDPQYKLRLESLSGWQKRAWLHGDWDIAAGQFFTTFRRSVHVTENFNDACGVDWFAAMDYGYNHYTVVLLACTDSDGNVFVIDEHAQRQTIPQLQAEAIRKMFARHRISTGIDQTCHNGRSLSRFVAGADLFGTRHDGTSIAARYRELGLSMRPANMDRICGWAEVHSRLGDPDRGIAPRLFIHKRCGRLIDCLPHLQHDPNRPEDVLKMDTDDEGVGGDDSADALRYLLATKPPGTIVMRKLRGL